MKLVVVESPAKVKTISKYLGNKYKVVASMGHVVDLPKNELGVDEKTYKPKYIVTNKKALKNVKDSFKGIKTLIIASDLDREGEAIGWHIAQELGVIDKRGKIKNSSKKLERIIFSSITEEAINEAINNPRNIDFDLVDAQQTRRILDRLFGYKLSPLIWKKIKYGLSAGRVQSVAVRLIVDREDERDKFDPKEYWSIFADLLTKYKQSEITREIVKKKDDKTIKFKGIKFELVKINSKKVEIGNSRNAESIINKLPDKGWIIDDIIKKETKRYPKPPFITSTLQRTAVNLFGFSAKRTMRIAQSLYESGYITYMRTDSFNINKKELSKIRNYIRLNFGENYLSNKEIIYKAKSAQEAHEAIRPTNISRTSDSIHNSTDAKRIYELIRNRTLACQMSNASIENTKVYIRINKYLFQASGIRTLFEGYLKVYKEVVSENLLPKLEKKQELFLNKVIGEQHFTSPPPRYSEATLIKTLEQFGIGRPSTYAPIISTILARKYVIKEGKYFIPTDTGKIVTRLLKKYFSEIVDTGFTAEIEKDLDEIALGKKEKYKVINIFYKPFIKKIKEGESKISRNEFTVLGKSSFKCPLCKGSMVKKLGKFGIFLSCKKFPKCKGMRSLDGKTDLERSKEVERETKTKEFLSKYLKAPDTSDGLKMVLKLGRYGKFWAHPDYPKTKESKPLMLKEKCPKCKEPLVERMGRWGKTFIGCSGFPKCRYIKKVKAKKAKKDIKNVNKRTKS